MDEDEYLGWFRNWGEYEPHQDGAQICRRCGCVVASSYSEEHDEFHVQLKGMTERK